MNDAWSRFERTGTIRDYLDYVSQSRGQMERPGGTQMRMQEQLQNQIQNQIQNPKRDYERKVESTHGTIDETNWNRTLFE